MRTKAHAGRILALATLAVFAIANARAGAPRHYPRHHARRATAPGLTDGNRFRLGLGLFRPDGDSAFWDDTFSVFTGSPGELEDISASADLVFRRTRWSAVIVSLEHEEGNTRQSYRFDPDGAGVFHDTRLRITPLTVGMLFYPAGDHRIAPYLGAGGGLYWWRYREAGDFLLLSDPAKPVVFESFESDGVTAGYYFLAGIDLPVQDDWSLFVEARWQRVDDEMNGDFEGEGTIDLSGRSLRAGVSWRF